MMDLLADQDYNRQRLEPTHGDPFYLHLSDLVLAMKRAIPARVERVLDYGCGGSPYRPLFGAALYHRADLAGTRSVDFEYGSDSRLPVNSSEYDCVLSSQVLEHVPSPDRYLEEAHRVLKPGGRLILSTHGLFDDHACPDDYWRWTVYGLSKLVESVETVWKLTTGPRAAIFFAERADYWPDDDGVGLYPQIVLIGLRTLRRVGARRIHQACDVCFPSHRMVDAKENGHNTYIAIALTARR
jgi:SAM-dependent methyltransferase